MALVTTPNGDTFDETSPVALAYYLREPGYEVEGSDTDAPVVEAIEHTVATFDPDAHTVEEVLDYLADASDEERERVLTAEAAGKGRKGIVETE